MRDRVSVEDLDIATQWLRSYEPQEGDDNGERFERVARFLETEMQRRKVAQMERVMVAAYRGRAGEALTTEQRAAARRIARKHVFGSA